MKWFHDGLRLPMTASTKTRAGEISVDVASRLPEVIKKKRYSSSGLDPRVEPRGQNQDMEQQRIRSEIVYDMQSLLSSALSEGP